MLLKQADMLWLPMHDVRLRALAGTVEAGEVARKLTEEFGVPRTECALRHHAKNIGVSVRTRGGFTVNDLARLFKADSRCVRRWWIETGLLRCRRRVSYSARAHWWVERADLEHFIRTAGWAYDWRRMQEHHPLRALAEVVDRPDPWLTLGDLARFLGMQQRSVGVWVREGLVPHTRRYATGGAGEPVIRRSTFPAIKAAIDEKHATRWERARLASAKTRAQGIRRAPAWLENYHYQPRLEISA